MAHIGFYHPERGYWQATSEPSEEVRATYPEGTVRVQIKPGADYHWQDGEWVFVAPARDDLLIGIRATRTSLLVASDWTQMPDSPLSAAEKSVWATYRQALRDITESEDLSAVVWPTAPT
ncbi:tail fiber assembly protein [Celeribacter naphthalenivorans]|uniref:tail fiber assembly protein n=1 Tax=Celeribacter naphthalenivorans TaxID=1614694 RepID=UPI001CFA996F|nr:tail fiber assembly protein [Celeribacter naphthalenivorans]